MCQVALDDPSKPNYPVPEPGDEVFVTETCVAVATRPDWVDDDLRDLPVEVWLEDENDVDALPDGELIHDGQITFAGDLGRVGNYLASDLHDVPVKRGLYRVRVLREPPGGPAETVRFVLSGA